MELWGGGGGQGERGRDEREMHDKSIYTNKQETSEFDAWHHDTLSLPAH